MLHVLLSSLCVHEGTAVPFTLGVSLKDESGFGMQDSRPLMDRARLLADPVKKRSPRECVRLTPVLAGSHGRSRFQRVGQDEKRVALLLDSYPTSPRQNPGPTSERRGPDSNRCTRLCRPLPNLSATAPARLPS